MIGLIQRVTCAQIEVDDQTISRINNGIFALIGVERSDTEKSAEKLLQRILGYRIFADPKSRMNLSLTDIAGDLLLVPQFTLPADTKKGMRPSFSRAAPPLQGQALFTFLLDRARSQYPKVESGRFGVDMKITSTNDGPVTFWLQV